MRALPQPAQATRRAPAMNADTPVTFDGITQPITEWAFDYGIPADLIVTRLDEGMPIEAAITTPMVAVAGQRLPKPPRTRLYTLDGETLSIKEWSERTGIPKSTIAQRLSRGTPLEVAIDREKNPKKNLPHTHDGETLTVAEWAAKSGISYETLSHRIRKGMTIGEALTMQKHAHPPIPKKTGTLTKPTSAKRKRRTVPVENAVTITVGTIRITITTADDDRGVPSNCAISLETGGRSTTQDSVNLDFSERSPE
ncbi:hypothetical protein [Pararhizobium mangrovi]|uniref:Uncharacterized protein n=1 Tax=Pararhizobium mangrovi TaxID=2590452 RepID=A0A506U3C0_9HYPH|nr:hypothetical protein [Pararhizobium mangrovi]TPW26387.1 hypothetical protein FJU11_15030 [Pararhizobium mangrovi]